MQPQNGHHESATGQETVTGPGPRPAAPHVFKYTYFSWPRMGSTLRMIYMAIAAYADANG